MAILPEVIATGDKSWQNRHETFIQPIDNLFTIMNGDSGNLINDYNATTTAIQTLLGNAVVAKRTLRALGGCWSFSDIAATDGWLVNTLNLNLLFRISGNSIDAKYTGDFNQLLFVQCGTSIQELNRYLEPLGKALKTTGASNGQTIVGATSTGTHGAALGFGATQDFVVGIHIIVSQSRHIWLERDSYPVVSNAFASNIKAEIIRNDNLFNAAVVGIGSMGFIHGVMIETEPIYLLEGFRELVPFNNDLKQLMSTLDFTKSTFLNNLQTPFHFQVIVNQYNIDFGAYVITMYKNKYHADYTPPVSLPNTAGPGDDAPLFIGKITDFVPASIPLLVNNLIKSELTIGKWTGTTGQIFTNTTTHGKVFSTAMGIPLEYVSEVVDLLISLNKQTTFPGIFAFRYVKKSAALIAFTKYDLTCVVELDGVQSDITRKFYNDVWKALDDRKIPYTFHWGKVHNLDQEKIKQKYTDTYLQWINARNVLLTSEMRNVFSSKSLRQFGLDLSI